MQMLRSEDLRPHLDLPALMDFMEARHRDPKGETADSLIGPDDNRYLVRSATSERVYGTKLVTIVPGNASRGIPSVQALFVVFDRDTGRLLAAMEATELTYWKTAADSGLGSRYLSNPKSITLLVCGAGGLAPWLVRGHLAARPSLSRILIWNRMPQAAHGLVTRLAQDGLPAAVAVDLPQAVAEADIVCTATMARDPFLKGEWLRAGQHVDLVGSYGPDTRESDDECLKRARVFTDSRDTALHGVGDILAPIASGAFSADRILGDHYDLAAGHLGRMNDSDITLFKNAGGAHLDLMTAEFLISRLGRPNHS